MPFHAKRKSRYKRRPYRRRNNNKGKMVRYRQPKTFDPVPDSKMVSFRYSTTITLAPPAGTLGTWVFRANDLFDPDLTGSGHQPMAFDQWMVFYNFFTVVGSLIEVRFSTSATTSALGNVICMITLDDNVSGETSIDTVVERNKSSVGYLNPQGSSNSSLRLKRGMSAKKFFGKTHVIADSLFRGTTGASPSELCFFNVSAGTAEGGSVDPGSIFCNVIITYNAVLTERLSLGQS